MTRYLLDTNIISEAVKATPAAELIDWLARQDDDSLCIAAFSVAEIARGILAKPQGRRRRQLEAWFAGPEGPPQLFADSILPFDLRAALAWARLMAEGTSTGQPRSALDMIVAAVAEANDCIVVTGNERHFRGVVEMINPLSGSAET
ncbi:MAG: type II toxin-antitoxin system VapC family toxin [Geminicoccaceae bacterium]